LRVGGEDALTGSYPVDTGATARTRFQFRMPAATQKIFQQKRAKVHPVKFKAIYSN